MGYVLEVGESARGAGVGGKWEEEGIGVWDQNGAGERCVGECRQWGKERMGRMMTLFRSRTGATAIYNSYYMLLHRCLN